MLTFQSAKLLYNLRQINNPYIFDTNNFENQALIVDFNSLKFVKSSYYTYDESTSFVARLDELNYLEDNGYIKTKKNLIAFTHKGYRPFQISTTKFLSFVGKSIVTPIIVSMLTAYLTVLFLQ